MAVAAVAYRRRLARSLMDSQADRARAATADQFVLEKRSISDGHSHAGRPVASCATREQARGSVGKVTAHSRDDASSSPTEVRSARGPEAAAAVLFGGVLAVFFGFWALALVRETLHFNCSWGIGGEWGPYGTWVCADGIGYLGVAVVLGGMSALLVVTGLLVSVARPSRGRAVVFLMLAAISIAWIGW